MIDNLLSMEITLSPAAEKIIRRKLESGGFQSADDVISAALDLMEQQEGDWAAKIDQGLAEARAGQLLDIDEVQSEMTVQKAAWRAAQRSK